MIELNDPKLVLLAHLDSIMKANPNPTFVSSFECDHNSGELIVDMTLGGEKMSMIINSASVRVEDACDCSGCECGMGCKKGCASGKCCPDDSD